MYQYIGFTGIQNVTGTILYGLHMTLQLDVVLTVTDV